VDDPSRDEEDFMLHKEEFFYALPSR